MAFTLTKQSALAAVICSALTLSACSDSNNNSNSEQADLPSPDPVVTFDYRITVKNLTPEQPFSPVTVIAHNFESPQFVAGTAASQALELLAEGGSNLGFENNAGVSQVVAADSETAPGATEVLELSFNEDQLNHISVLTMLVNTNDAFTGISNFDLTSLENGEKVTFRANVYDAGTEANSEARGTIPGPADGGQGYNPQRNDVNKVHIHPGVISKEDGFAASVLFAKHRFDNPAMSVVIERTK